MTNYNTYRHLGFTTISNALIAFYPQLGISDPQFVLLLQLEAYNQKQELLPSPQRLSANTNMSATEVSSIIQGLIEKHLLTIRQTNDAQGKISDGYDLSELYEKLDQYLKKNLVSNRSETDTSQMPDNSSPLQKLVRQFEIEFGRLLSPIEREEIADWLTTDHYDPEIISLALRESVLAQVYNFKYVDRILLNWQRLNLQTTSEVQNYLQRN